MKQKIYKKSLNVCFKDHLYRQDQNAICKIGVNVSDAIREIRYSNRKSKADTVIKSTIFLSLRYVKTKALNKYSLYEHYIHKI